ncbi:MAG: ABC transporter permease, partial [Planctomycetes bacterium]|nr:ABC transporter permease [Planctomycetota bacterium]
WTGVFLWAIYAAAVVVGTRQGWLLLFGPVLFYDMVRTARQSRYVLLRLAYALLLLMILWMVFSDRPMGGQHSRREAAVLAETFFSVFMCVQLGMVVLLTPAYVAGPIADEKDRKTPEFMLATDLNNHEIVLSKLLSRLANMTSLLVTGLPILSILQLVGGVDSELMLMGFAGTGLTMLGVGSVSILCSVLFQRPRDAIGISYVCLVAYGALATVGAIDRAQLGAVLVPLVTRYAIFHGILSLACILWSIARLRVIALQQTVSGTTQELSWWEQFRAPIGDLPMLWKELYIEGRLKFNWLIWGLAIILVLITVGIGLWLIGQYLWDIFVLGAEPWIGFSMQLNIWFRIAGTGVASLLLLMIGVRASTCITSERERDTFDALLTTPMTAEEILTAKLVGCLTSMRLGWIWFGSMLALGLFTGAVHPLAAPLVVVSWCIYAVGFALVGLFYSIVFSTSMRATVFTVLTTLFLGGGHWLLMAICCYIPGAMARRMGPDDGMVNLAKVELGMTPPFVLGFFSYSWENLAHDFTDREFGIEMFGYSLVGLFLWVVGCWFLWYGAIVPKFRALARREDVLES